MQKLLNHWIDEGYAYTIWPLFLSAQYSQIFVRLFAGFADKLAVFTGKKACLPASLFTVYFRLAAARWQALTISTMGITSTANPTAMAYS